jgi:hypothetical protein
MIGYPLPVSFYAVEGDGAETFDSCNGHTSGRSVYHYHQTPGSHNCGITNTAEKDQFIGWFIVCCVF